jgi:hypothetical protein
MTFTTKLVFCCYTCDGFNLPFKKHWIIQVFRPVHDKNETTLYFFVDYHGFSSYLFDQTLYIRGFCYLFYKNNGY